MVLMNLFARQQWRHRHREQTYGHGVGGTGGRKERRDEWRDSMETYTLLHVT